MSRPICVLFTHYGDDWIRGSERVLLDLLGALDRDKICPIVWCNGAEMYDAARAAGCTAYRDDFRHILDYSSPRPDFWHYLGLIRKARALCKRHDVQVLHSNSLAPTQWLAPASIQSRLPLVTHLHASYLRRSRYVLGLHAATLIVGCSDAVISGALADGVAPSRVRVIPNGLDFSRLNEAATDLRATLRIPVESQVIASVGSLKQLKGHDIVINAFRSLPGEPHLILAGSGEEERNLRQQAEVLGIAKRVHFIGETKNTGSVYRAADIFALGTRNEAFGLVLAEAGYFGLPSVSTKVGGIPHVVLNGHTGLLVTSNDTTQFQVALATLAADPALRRRMGAAATRHVEQHFSAPRMAREFEGIYAQLAETPRHRLGWRQAVRNVARPYSKLAPFVERVAR